MKILELKIKEDILIKEPYIDGKPTHLIIEKLRLLDKELLIDEILKLKITFDVIRRQLNNTVEELESLLKYELGEDSDD